jgi:hypothetical protein
MSSNPISKWAMLLNKGFSNEEQTANEKAVLSALSHPRNGNRDYRGSHLTPVSMAVSRQQRPTQTRMWEGALIHPRVMEIMSRFLKK